MRSSRAPAWLRALLLGAVCFSLAAPVGAQAPTTAQTPTPAQTPAAAGTPTAGQTPSTTRPVAAGAPTGGATTDAAASAILALLPRGRETIVALAEAVSSGDLTRAREAYARSRVPWETIEIIIGVEPDLEPMDKALDAREDDFPGGVNDPNWTGWHRLERGLWVAGSTNGLEPIARRMVSDWDAFAAALQQAVSSGAFTPAAVLDSAAGLLDEAGSEKITGEEERYSKLDLVIFQANLAGAEIVFDAYRDQIAARDRALASEIAQGLLAARASLQPYVRSETDVTNFDDVPEAARNRIGTTFRALAGAFERAAQLF